MNRFNNWRGLILGLLVLICGFLFQARKKEGQSMAEPGLIGYWKLSGDALDKSGNNLASKIHGKVDFKLVGSKGAQSKATGFDGQSSWLEVPANPKIKLGSGDFSVAAWIYTENALNDIPGDIISQYDPATKRGFHLSLKDNAGITSHANFRQLSFGIDNNISSGWEDYGKPGNALLAFGTADYKGDLYAGTCEVGSKESGHVYRLAGKNNWVNCGAPDRSNSVVALAVLNDQLYAGTGNYRVAGSSLPEADNTKPGGRVFRYGGPNNWIDCGQLPGVETIGGMIVFNGKLYATSMYRPSAFYRYEGGKTWVKCNTPDGKRVVNMAVYNGYLYATSWDHGNVYRYDGTDWVDCGLVGNNTQTYAFTIYQGGLYTATWPSGRVFRFDGIQKWTDVGRLGSELEVMGMLVHNGRFMAGTLPLAEVYDYNGDTTWTRMDQLDRTPDVKYRRAWSMGESAGKLFCTTLPSGKIFGFEAGKSVVSKAPVPSGWQHVAATKTGNSLKLFVNGKMVNETTIPSSMTFDLNSNAPLKIGFGQGDYFNGRMREVRLYNRAIDAKEVKKIMVN